MSLVSDLLSFEAFANLLLVELAIAPTLVSDETRLAEELAFDSVLLFELLLVVEEWIGVMLPEALLGQLLTMGDVYDVYRTRMSHR